MGRPLQRDGRTNKMLTYEEVMVLEAGELAKELDSCETALKQGILFCWVSQANAAEQEIGWIRNRAKEIGAKLRYRDIDGEIFTGVKKLYLGEPLPWHEYEKAESLEWDGKMPMVDYVISATDNGFAYDMYLVGPAYGDGREFVESRDGFASEDDAEDAVWQKADDMFGKDGWYQY